MKIIKFIFGRILAFCVCFAFLASGGDPAKAMMLAGLGMIIQFVVHYAVILVMYILSSWFGIEYFNSDRFTRMVGPFAVSYFITIAVVAGLAGVR